MRDLLHVRDLVALYFAAFERADAIAGRVFNVGGGRESTLSLLELVERLGVSDGIAFKPERAGDQKVFVADNGLAHSALGWEPTVPLDDGLDELERWVRAHRDEASVIIGGA